MLMQDNTISRIALCLSNELVFITLNGSLVKSFETNTGTDFNPSVWIVIVKDSDGQRSINKTKSYSIITKMGL